METLQTRHFVIDLLLRLLQRYLLHLSLHPFSHALFHLQRTPTMDSNTDAILTPQPVKSQADESWADTYRSNAFAKLGSSFAAPIEIETTPAAIVGIAAAAGLFCQYPRLGAQCTVYAVTGLVGIHAGNRITYNYTGYRPLYRLTDSLEKLSESGRFAVTGSDLVSLLVYKLREEA